MHQLTCNPDWIYIDGSSKCTSETRPTHQLAEISGQWWQGSFIATDQGEKGLFTILSDSRRKHSGNMCA